MLPDPMFPKSQVHTAPHPYMCFITYWLTLRNGVTVSQLLRGQELGLIQRGRGCSAVPSQEVQSESLLSQAPEKHRSSLCLRNLQQRECGHRLVFVFFQRTGNPGPLRKRSGVSPGPRWGLHPDSSNLL